jgi:Tfp pilus assembly protein PilF
MPKLNKGAVARTALFFLFLTPLVLPSCRNSSNSGKKAINAPVAVAAPDSSNPEVIGKLIRENPKSPALFAKRARLYADKSNYTQALSDITIALKMDSARPDYYTSQAEYYMFNGETNSAKKVLNLCLKKFPDNTDVLLKMAEIHLYMKEYGQAKLVLRQVLPINDELARLYFLQGLIALETNDTLGAVKNFQTAIDKEPDYYAAYIQAGRIYSGQGNPLAMQYFKSAIDLMPGMYEAHYLLGYYYQEHGFLDEADQEYEFISTKIDSTQADPYFNRGFIQMVYRGNPEEAKKWFDKAIRWNPKSAKAWYNRGFSSELSGKLADAKSDYRKAMDIEPNFPLAIKGLNRIADGKPIKK